MFVCDKCGLCCMNLGRSSIYAGLDRGDGICRYFDEEFKLCTIYESRPLLCNVDETYKHFFRKEMTKEDYYNLNYESCKIIKNNIRWRK